jgi:hypothetical protein
MKRNHFKLFHIVLVLFFAVFLGACKKNYLNLDPPNSYTYYNFPTNESQIEQAIVANYRHLFNFYNSSTIWFIGDYMSDNTSFLFAPANRGQVAIEEVDEFVARADNGNYSAIYQNGFTGVQRANYVLESIDKIFFNSDSIKNIRRAEALFFRAWHYFTMVQLYGDLPIIKKVIIDPRVGENPSQTFPRRPVAEVFSDLIIPDAQAALNALPQTVPASQRGRLTKSVARMLLGKIYMERKNWAEALTVLQPLTTSGFSLNISYANNFNPATKNGVESIFEIQADQLLGYSFGFQNGWAPANSGTSVWPGGSNAGNYFNQPTASLNSAYETNDLRKVVTIGAWVQGANTFLWMRKFANWDAVQRANASNWPVYRYADVLLMIAECLNEQGFPNSLAFSYLNQVRTRAGLPNKTQGNANPALSVDDQAAFRLAIEQERRVEFAGEGHRWFDLLRTGRAVAVMTAHGIQEKVLKTTVQANAYTTFRSLLPIPDREIVTFGYAQNPGW